MRADKSRDAHGNSLAGKGLYPPGWAFLLLFPLRRLIFSPRTLMRRLALREDMRVLEVGPGPGYFSLPLAKSLPRGHLTLADVQPVMLAKAKSRLERARARAAAGTFASIAYHRCDGSTFPFADGEFDRIVLVTVLGEVEHRAAYLREFRRLLQADGLLSVTELAGDPDRLPVETIVALGAEAGLEVAGRFGGRKNYTVNLRPAGANARIP